MIRLNVIILIASLLIACGTSESNETKDEPLVYGDTAERQVIEQTSAPKHALLNTYTLKTGTSFIVVEKKRSASLSLITVQGTGFSDGQNILTFRNSDPIEKAEVMDLDGDGYEEVYIFTRNVGSGSYGNIIAVASIRDRTYEEIGFEQSIEGDPNFQGYGGLDRFRFAGGQLMRDMPIYKQTDTNNKPTGGVRTLAYDLERVDGSLRLVVQ